MRLHNGAMILDTRIVNPSSPSMATYASVRIDTGDDVALLDPAIISAIGATPTGSVMVMGLDGRVYQAPTYTLDVDLGSGGYLAGVTFAAVDVSDLGVQGLFGDNELDRGVLVRNGPAKSFDFVVAEPSAGAPSPPNYGLAAAALVTLVGFGAMAWAMVSS